MDLAQFVNTLGQDLLRQYGERVHKVSIDAGFNCPNRDGRLGVGGCTFCNNASFIPGQDDRPGIHEQVRTGAIAVERVTGARKLLAYFQAYTNTYADVELLNNLYQQALMQDHVVGISVGTRPDCVPDPVLDLLAHIQAQGHLVWLELGLQSSFDETLQRVNRGHDYACYVEAVERAHQRGLKVCTHLILGLHGEGAEHARITLSRVLEQGVEGLKLHPLHVVKSTRLAFQWRRGEYEPLQQQDYIDLAVELIRRTPQEVIFHRLTGTASHDLLLAPAWCEHKWAVINGISGLMAKNGWHQGDLCVADQIYREPLSSDRMLRLGTTT